jgi:hypothetical protein
MYRYLRAGRCNEDKLFDLNETREYNYVARKKKYISPSVRGSGAAVQTEATRSGEAGKMAMLL